MVAIHDESWAEADLLTVLEQGHQLLLCQGPTHAAMETLMTRSVHISPVPTKESTIEYIVTVKPLLSGHLQDLPKCSLNRGCPLNRSL